VPYTFTSTASVFRGTKRRSPCNESWKGERRVKGKEKEVLREKLKGMWKKIKGVGFGRGISEIKPILSDSRRLKAKNPGDETTLSVEKGFQERVA